MGVSGHSGGASCSPREERSCAPSHLLTETAAPRDADKSPSAYPENTLNPERTHTGRVTHELVLLLTAERMVLLSKVDTYTGYPYSKSKHVLYSLRVNAMGREEGCAGEQLRDQPAELQL